LLLPIAPGSPFARAIGFRLVENTIKRPVNVISLSLVWLDHDVELDLRPGSRCFKYIGFVAPAQLVPATFGHVFPQLERNGQD
jgi:hypothetical protein